jgi:diguanylate cyclase (GGDEF)-like protein
MTQEIVGKDEEFVIQMLEEYYALLQQIDLGQHQQFQADAIESIINSPLVTDHEKRLHYLILDKVKRFNERFSRLHWMSEHMKVLHELGQTFTKTFDKGEIYQKAFELVSRVMDADAFFIAFYNEGDPVVQVPFSVDNGVRYEPSTIPFGEGMVSKVLETRRAIHIADFDSSGQNYVHWGNPEQNTTSCIFVPMLLNNQIKGVISAQNYRAFAYRSEHEELLRIIGIQVTNAIETAQLYDKVYDMSIKDELTQIKNSRAFHSDLEIKIAEAGEENLVTLIMLDSDNLKKVNDQFGHHMGDLLIQKLAEALQIHLSNGEEAYRYAGDEFMIIAPQLSVGEAEKKVGMIQQYLGNHPIEYQGEAISVCVSVGIASYPYHAESADELKRSADAALYESKNLGKNKVTVYNSDLK